MSLDKEKLMKQEIIFQMSEKYKKTSKYLNYVEHLLLVVASTITGCVSISAFASIVCVPVDIKSSVIEIKIFLIPVRIKKYKSIMKKEEKA